MTKNKLAKLAATSAPKSFSGVISLKKSKRAAQDPQAQGPAPMLKFSDDGHTASFNPTQGAAHQLTAEVNSLNLGRWAPNQPAAFHRVNPFPAAVSVQDDVDVAGVGRVPDYPLQAPLPEFIPPSDNDFYAGDLFAEEEHSGHTIVQMPELSDMNVFLPGDVGVSPEEVLRQSGLDEQCKDGLNDFFDFGDFE